MKHGDKIKRKILDVGLSLYPHFTASDIAREIGVTVWAVTYHFPTKILKDAVARHAVETGNSRVIVQLVACHHKAVANLSEREIRRHLKSFN